MSITTIPTRTSADSNASADINTLMTNIANVYASLGGGGGGKNYISGAMRGNIYVPSSVEFEYIIPEAKTLTSVKAKLGTACTGANTNIAFYKNSATIATLAISASSTALVSKTVSATIGADAVVSWKPTQVGSTISGANLLISGILE